ncbi:MFS transporter [Oscillochloris sp. ZM17-4]|uniref:MFS transporter n=1 Tax=Oscillochloris sp. ZM17-4 TaxID=2866714 RepID=UPI001C7352F2|nr:MFS transporter [Oscillochloris sp. ZM17-4]MBX0330718.1 MFS transporter [Oscillochloris sp. ZM17-4]
MSTHTTGAPAQGAIRTLALACGVFLASGTMLASVGPCLPFLAQRAGQELASLSWIFTAFSGGVVVMQVGFGPAADRMGLRGVLAAGMALMGGGMLGLTLATSLAVMLAAAGVAGVGFGGVIAAGNVLVARMFEARSATALNGANVFFGVGAIIGPVIVGQAGERLGLPQAALWAGSALILALAPLVLWLAGSPPAGGHGGADEAGGPKMASPVWMLGLLLLIYTGTEVGFGGWVTVYMQRSAGMALADATLMASAFWLALTGGRVLGAALGMQASARGLLLAALAGLAAGALMLALSVGAPGRSLAGVLLLGLACGPVFPTVLALITTAARGDSRAAGLAIGLGNSGGLVLPALLGLLLASYGPQAMISVVLACALAMLATGAVALRGTGGAPRPEATPTA